MALVDTLPIGSDTAQWSVWGTTARIVVTNPDRLAAARGIVEAQLAAVDKACSRFRKDSELEKVHRSGGRPVRISRLLAELIDVSLTAARRTRGDVDPTVGTALRRLGYNRDLSVLPVCGSAVRVVVGPAAGWQQVRLDGRRLTVPAGVLLDLGATAKAFASDRCAELMAERCGVGVLVSLGGDIATAGPVPEGGWRVLVRDQPGDPQCTIALPNGGGLATSSTVSRQWRQGGRTLHHILDPRTSQPVAPVWRTASIVANTCVDANTFSTAALIRGYDAPIWLHQLGLPARLVSRDGNVVTLNGWPDEDGMR